MLRERVVVARCFQECWIEIGDNSNKIGWTKCTLQADVFHFNTRKMAVACNERGQAAVGLGWATNVEAWDGLGNKCQMWKQGNGVGGCLPI